MEVISNCSLIGGNVGRIKCDKKRGTPKFLVLGDAVVSLANLATPALFKAAYVAATRVATGEPGKLFPSPQIQNVANNTEAPTTGTLGLGYSFEIRAGIPTYTFGFIMGINAEVKWLEFHNQTIPATIIDDAQIAWGVETSDGGFAGAECQISVTSKPFNDGNTAENILTTITVSYVNPDDFKFPAIVQTNLKAGDLEGLLDVRITYLSKSSNAWTYKLTVDNVELAAQFPLPNATLAALVLALWEAGSGPSGATPLDIDSVSIVGGNVVITYDSTAYTAVTNGTLIWLRLVSPTDLSTAGVIGLEGIPNATAKAA